MLDAIEATNYRPSRLAADLSRGTPTSVAILVPFLTRPSVVARLAGVIKALDAEGYDTIVCNVETPAQRDRQVHMLAAGHRAAGLVLISLRLAAGRWPTWPRPACRWLVSMWPPAACRTPLSTTCSAG